MKNSPVFYFILLLVWIAGCAYIYVCQIRNDCRPATDMVLQQAVDQEPATTDSLQLPGGQAATPPPGPLTLYFGLGENTCELSSTETEQINLMVSYLLANPSKKLSVIGHTDATGPASVNNTLSLMRAAFVKQLFMAKNVDSLVIEADGRGELEPASADTSDSGLAKNRRVEIQII